MSSFDLKSAAKAFNVEAEPFVVVVGVVAVVVLVGWNRVQTRPKKREPG